MSLGSYHRYYADPAKHIRNEYFDAFSTELLNLKAHNPWTILDFYIMLDPIIPRGTSLCVVPSSKCSKKISGIKEVAKILCADPLMGRKDQTDYLVRTIDVPSHSEFQRRNKATHLMSISAVPGKSVRGEHIILLDDICTTGFSLRACRDILMLAGAASVHMLAIAQTIYETVPATMNNLLTEESTYA